MTLASASGPSSPRDLGSRFRWGLALLGLFFSTTGALCSPDDAPPPSVCGGVPCLEPCNRPATAPAAFGYLGAPGDTGCSPNFRCIVEPDQTAGQCWNKQDLCLPDTYITVSQETFVPSADCGAGQSCRVIGANAWFGRCVAAPGGAGGSGGSGGASTGGAGGSPGGSGGSPGGSGGAGGAVVSPVDLCEGSLPDTLVHTPGAAVDYVVNCRVQLTSATSVQPGVVIAFTTAGILELQGASLVGTAEAPIRLMPQDNGQTWRGVEVFGKEPSTLQHVQISSAGASSPEFALGAALRVGAAVYDQGTVSIRDCVFEASAGVGISFGEGGTAKVFENNSIKGSKSFAIEATPEALDGLGGPGNLYNSNEPQAVSILDSSLPLPLFGWHRLPIPYRVSSPLQLQGKHVFDPGVIVEMTAGARINLVTTVEGVASLVGKGKQDALIEFRGLNGNPGEWSGIALYGAAIDLSLARISGGGAFQDVQPAGMILVDPNSDGSAVSIRDCVMENSSSYAIVLNGAQANSDISSANTFTNNKMGNVAP